MSNEMNPWLAEIYGTNGAEDLEKTAQEHLFFKLAEEQNVDLSQFSPEELQQLYAEFMAGENVPGQQAAPPAGQPQMFAPAAQPQQQMGQQMPFQGQQPQTQQQPSQPQAPQGMMGYQMAPQQGGQDQASLQKEAQAKFEEADLLGRVMAHSYTQELEKIASSREKTAGRFEGAKNALKAGAGKAKGFGHRAAEHVKKHKGAYGAGAGGAAAGFAAGRMSKEASAFEKLAEIHAAEILGSAGFDPQTGQDMAGQQQQTNDQQMQQQVNPQTGQAGQEGQQGQQGAPQQQQFAEALDQRALEMLENAGYDVNEILARLQFAGQQQPQA